MTDDIVARLRVLNHHAKKLAENESLHDLYRDAFTRCENLTWEAADEIERLRVIVQKCTRLARNAKNAILTLRAERDEARREICDRVSTTKYEPQFALMSALQYAEERDWDCFEEVK